MEGGSIGINQRAAQPHFIMETHAGTSSSCTKHSFTAFHRLQNVTDCSKCDCGGTLFQRLNKHFTLCPTSLPHYHHLLHFKIEISNNLLFFLPTGSTLPISPPVDVLNCTTACWFSAEALGANLLKRAGAFYHSHPV